MNLGLEIDKEKGSTTVTTTLSCNIINKLITYMRNKRNTNFHFELVDLSVPSWAMVNFNITLQQSRQSPPLSADSC